MAPESPLKRKLIFQVPSQCYVRGRLSGWLAFFRLNPSKWSPKWRIGFPFGFPVDRPNGGIPSKKTPPPPVWSRVTRYYFLSQMCPLSVGWKTGQFTPWGGFPFKINQTQVSPFQRDKLLRLASCSLHSPWAVWRNTSWKGRSIFGTHILGW